MLCTEQATYWFNNTRALTKEKVNRSLLTQIINETSFLPTAASAPQRLWHLINNTNVVPMCKMCDTHVSWDRRFKTYKTYCGSPKCVNTDPSIVERKRAQTNYDSAKIKRQQTNVERYGHTNYLASPNSQFDRYTPNTEEYFERAKKRKETLLSTRGVENISHTSLKEGVLEKLRDPSWLKQQHYTDKKSLTEIASDLQIQSGCTIVSRYIKEAGLATQTPPACSSGERAVANYVESLVGTIVTRDRSVIAPYELDIYVPEFNVAIEYCGLYWHSEQQGKTRLYHATKQRMCNERGIQLLTIFEDEWVNRRCQVEQKLASVLKRDSRMHMHARKCKVVAVSPETRDQFLDAYHIQGSGSGSVTYGLQFNDNLVAVMTWIEHKPSEWTLNRYATSQHVIGGFTKLVSHFKKHNTWTRLISFADLRWSTGNLYAATGWKQECIIPPDYSYSPDGKRRIHKFNYRRHNLPKLLATFDPRLSEWENCKTNNVLRIWDCGKIRFVMEQ